MCSSILPCVLRSQSVANVLFLLETRLLAIEEGMYKTLWRLRALFAFLQLVVAFLDAFRPVHHAMEALTQSCLGLVRGILLFDLVSV